jgi:hypothetical protein
MSARMRRDETLAPGLPSARALLSAPERLAYFSAQTQYMAQQRAAAMPAKFSKP